MNEGENQEWPISQLEYIDNCPICGCRNSNIIYENLKDELYNTIGNWTFYKCSYCKICYLSPRPTKSSINRAYEGYYTHKSIAIDKNNQLTYFKLIIKALANSYRNHRFGSKIGPELKIGKFLFPIISYARNQIEYDLRYLPKLNLSGKILDYGCGNGDFMLKAKIIGWNTIGLDFDPHAIKTAQLKGLEVYEGDLNALPNEHHDFDVITLCNVIEHVHEPRLLLRGLHALLKPGGLIYIETPNIESSGHLMFKDNWRGLEPPRHLLLYNWDAISKIAGEAGFYEINQKFISSNYAWIEKQSNAIKIKTEKTTLNESTWNKYKNIIQRHFTKSRHKYNVENLILMARKPF